ncbi:MAG: L-seryl-tRNA(Sec) selenium transferase [Thermodesulfobacteriota bacterium]|nr:L-seryl-tRNA(Sec) selenium transferase [Thermodesulfobacteriota bacterium]
MKKNFRSLPSVDKLLKKDAIESLIKAHSRYLVVGIIRDVVQKYREKINSSSSDNPVEEEVLIKEIKERVDDFMSSGIKKVINATGIVIHTNLGRALLCKNAVNAAIEAAENYSNLEFDLNTGERGSRMSHVQDLLCHLTGAEESLVLNNNAGAVFLALNSLACRKEVVISRGELVEIGGSFRLPEIMERSGTLLREIGTTNRTVINDYLSGISENTGLLLKVKKSNFKMTGYTAEVSLKEIVSIGRERNIPVMEDMGSGCFIDLSSYGLKTDTVNSVLKTGVDIVTFSGDKLLGGPQAGIILGKKEIVNIIRKNPLTRILRVDKLTLSALFATLRLYYDKEKAISQIPTIAMLTKPLAEIEKKAGKLYNKLKRTISSGFIIEILDDFSAVGGGALTGEFLPTKIVSICHKRISLRQLFNSLLKSDPPMVSRIKNDKIYLDLRTIKDYELNYIEKILTRLL